MPTLSTFFRFHGAWAFVCALPLGSAWCFAGCSNSGDPSSLGAAGNGGEDPLTEAGAAGVTDEPVPESLSFVPSKTLELAPKEARMLTVQTTPPGIFHIRFALPASASDNTPNDAVLDASEVDSGDDGVAQVTLTAPSAPSTFSVRASVAGKVPSTLLGVSVSSTGYTTLRVKPTYTGHRAVKTWTASARTGSKCKKLVGTPPPDGDLTASANEGRALDIEHVPVGVALTVTLRSGHYIGGCTDQAALSEADGQQALVYASDRALNLPDTRVDLNFGPSDVRPEFSKLMKDSAIAAEAVLGGPAQNDVQVLLDAMHDVTTPANRDAFSASRFLKNWDYALATAIGPGAESVLRDHADRWLSAGLATFATPNTFSGPLAADPSGSGGALFELLRVAQIPAEAAGFTSHVPSTWSADSSDTVVLGMELGWVPSRLVTALAVAPALLEYPQATSVEDALAQSLSCTLVGKTLLANGSTTGSALYPGCDESCGRITCANALSALWSAVRESSGTANAKLSVTATAAAEVGDEAQATNLQGSWIGALDTGADRAAVSGALSAFGAGL